MSRLGPALNEAQGLGMKVCLNGVWLDTLGATIFDVSSGRWCRYEAEALCALGDSGATVQDYRAVNGYAWGVGQASGWFQSDTVGAWGDVSSLPYTAVFRLRADTMGAGGPTTPVCSLVVKDFYLDINGSDTTLAESLVGDTVLRCGDFPRRDSYEEFAVYFHRVQDSTAARSQYRVYSCGNVDSLWSDNVELFDAYADGLLRIPSGAPQAPLAQKVTAAASRYINYDAVYRFFMKDEPAPEMFRSCAAVCRAVGAANSQWSGITWVNWWSGHPERWEQYVDSVGPRELWADVYPLMGQVYPSQCTIPPPNADRTPVDGGVEFQSRLDYMCDSVLAPAREATLGHGEPLWVDVQAFGEYFCPDANLVYDTALNHVNGPSTPPRHDESIWREPTPRELQCMVWLALTYGAKGITYWLFPTVPGSYTTADTTKFFYLLGLMGWVGQNRVIINLKHPMRDAVPVRYRCVTFAASRQQRYEWAIPNHPVECLQCSLNPCASTDCLQLPHRVEFLALETQL